MKESFRFAIGGIPGTILNWIILRLSEIYLIDETKLILIWIIAFILREILSFSVHKFWTFKRTKEKKGLQKEITSYVGMMFLITIVNTASLYVSVEKLGFDSAWSQVVISIIFFFVNLPAVKNVFAKR